MTNQHLPTDVKEAPYVDSLEETELFVLFQGLLHRLRNGNLQAFISDELARRVEAGLDPIMDGLAGKPNATDLAAVATSGSYVDLTNRPALGTAAYQDVGAFPNFADFAALAAAVATGTRNYDTLLLANADLASIDEGGGVNILDDGSNNGYWVKQSGALVKKSNASLAGMATDIVGMKVVEAAALTVMAAVGLTARPSGTSWVVSWTSAAGIYLNQIVSVAALAETTLPATECIYIDLTTASPYTPVKAFASSLLRGDFAAGRKLCLLYNGSPGALSGALAAQVRAATVTDPLKMNAGRNYPLRQATRNGLTSTSAPQGFLDALLGVRVEGAIPGEVYQLSWYANGQADFGGDDWIIRAFDAAAMPTSNAPINLVVRSDGPQPHIDPLGGIQTIRIVPSNRQDMAFVLTIDAGKLPAAGTPIDASSSAALPGWSWIIDPSCYSRSPADTALIAELSGTPNIVPNPCLASALPSPRLTSAAVIAAAEAPLAAHFIERAYEAGTGGVAFFELVDIAADPAPRVAHICVYAWSETGSNWPSLVQVHRYLAGVSQGAIALSTVEQLGPNLRLLAGTMAIPAGTAGELRIGVPTGGMVAGSRAQVGGFEAFLFSRPVSWHRVPRDRWSDQYKGANIATALATIRQEKAVGVLRIAARALRASVAGSSITWGQGWLGQNSYVGQIEDYLRTVLATTKLPADMVFSGTNASISNPLFYKGAARALEGVNSEVSFTLDGDELSLCIARERGNVGAARVELYVDNVLHDTFSTFNAEPYGTGEAFAFTGDGTTRQFDLGRAFTFNHTLTVAGDAKTVVMNTQGSGASIPGGTDAMVIRKLVNVSGHPEVHHFLWFAVAPADGAAIAGTYDYGESITYVRNTVGQTARALTSANESAFGDGNVAFDPSIPAAVSSGLNFRESDARSVKSWHFDSAASRTIRLKIVALDPRGSGTPKLIINFATNRMHHIQNAGIGGWTAARLLTDTGLNGLQQVIDFAPDILLLESCTNDDWQVGVHRAWRARTGLNDATVRADSAAFIRTLSYGGSTYSMDDVRIPIAAITSTSLDLDMSGVTAVIVPGDVVTVGNFAAGDNRCLVSRLVKTWDSGAGRITWDKPLMASELAHVRSLSELVGAFAMVRGAPDWVEDLETIIDDMRAIDPAIEVALATGGIPNARRRRLEGYRELAMDVASRQGCGFVDFYRRTRDWQFSQPRTAQRYIGAGQATASTGAASYPLYNTDGSPATDADGTLNLARHWSVLVDGVERINRGCYVAGGPKTGWASGVATMTLANVSIVSDRYTLVFTDDVPGVGATIVVKRAADKWSSDDCHPNLYGMAVMGREALAFVEPAALEAASA
ncbi:hypothetical protein KYK30_20585 [Shinella yambaruensis]|uniref:Uncharacterized protein n=1 Tax=Shinella yambaruensis TaxID=415996 RepID=A0ABQ5ZGY1_9HYPH|nr:hypothetical protein [Shinella yambaruensis]MCJ8027007.1 hypothetical protein [Shinella yambaruensis]MCU7982101.1 hypothetical protein [Shinella yambaruensis]GLR51276.1 hypothetical protein GCM10007923_24840 [Shinella yambaruensis]